MVLRKMKEEDSARIAELEQEIFQDAWTKDGVDETRRQSHAFVVVAEEEQTIAGYCIVYHVLDEAEIARIAVAKDARRTGVGSRLLTETERICRESGITRILLDVRKSNEPARNFYRRHCFQEDGVRKNFYDLPREDAVLMSKELI